MTFCGLDRDQPRRWIKRDPERKERSSSQDDRRPWRYSGQHIRRHTI
jgi:hypothetical protein